MNKSILAVCFLVAGLSACGTVPVYNDAEPHYLSSSSTPHSNASVIVHFESMLPGRRFDEIVCDNVIGVFWSPEESRKIGFTQNPAEIVAKTVPLMAMEASLPGNIGIGRVASGQSSLSYDRGKIDSRIMVPFGTYISRDTEQLLGEALPSAKVCFDARCVLERAAGGSPRIITVHFTKFIVSEDHPNKLTLRAEGRVSVEGGASQSESSALKYEMVDRSITSEGYTHSAYLRVMNKLANEAASVIAEQILSKAY